MPGVVRDAVPLREALSFRRLRGSGRGLSPRASTCPHSDAENWVAEVEPSLWRGYSHLANKIISWHSGYDRVHRMVMR
jgi:hypothetical protein